MLPEQMLSSAEKFRVEKGEETPKWFLDCRRYFANESLKSITDADTLQRLYEIADEQLRESEYKHLVNPLNSKKKEYNSMPAKLRNYSIISPVIERLMGERRKRPNRYEVIPVGTANANDLKDKVKETYKAKMAEKLLFLLQGKGVPVETAEAPNDLQITQQQVEKEAILSYVEQKAKDGQTALEILNQDLRLEDKFQEGYYDFLVTGRVFDYKAIFNNNVVYQIVSPLEISVIGWDDTSKFAEDATAIVRRMKWSAASVIDNFKEYLDEDKIKKIKEIENRLTLPTYSNYVGSFRTPSGNLAEYNSGLLTVEHVVWKTLTKRGILTYATEYGLKQMPVGDDYKINKAAGDVSIEWTWENEWMETYVVYENINNNLTEDFIPLYWGIGQVQRTMLDNSSKCKLPYNGIVRGYRTNEIHSIVKTGLPYEELVNALHYRFDLALSRSYDKLMLFPLGLIPSDKGWDTERWMYSIRAFSIAFFDETKEKATATLQAIKEIDMSLGKYMSDMWQLIQMVKEEFWQAVGFNSQRFGDIGQYSGKSATNQALIQSISSTFDLNSIYEGFRESSLNALLDFSKFAWIDGKKGILYTPRSGTVQYEIDGLQYATTEFGVFVVNPQEEEEKLNFYKQAILQPLAQNGGQPDLIAEIIDTNSFTRVKELAVKARQIQEEYEMSKQQQIQQGNEQIKQMELQDKQIEREFQMQLAQLKANTEIEKALIMSDSFNAAQGDIDGDGVSESEEIVNRHLERVNMARQGFREEQQMNKKEAIENRKNDIKEEEISAKLEIAKINKNRYDKKS